MFKCVCEHVSVSVCGVLGDVLFCVSVSVFGSVYVCVEIFVAVWV